MTLQQSIRGCQICRARFAATATAHAPRPVVWFDPRARILIAGQAPGLRVHQSGQPFSDPSGERLRDWMALTPEQFYDRDQIAIVPMAFCFPGYTAAGHDLPPPPICATTWRAQVMAALPDLRLTLLLGAAAMRWHLGAGKVADRVTHWRDFAKDGIFPLPHPSWRNTGWLNRNPWFAEDLLPELRRSVATARATDPA